MGKIVYGLISPHPPLLIPEIGGRQINTVRATKKALEQAAAGLVASAPDTTVVFTPHSSVSRNTVRVLAGEELEGDFGMFYLPEVRYACRGDRGLAEATAAECKKAGFPAAQVRETVLDHGVMVPLHFLQEAGYGGRVLPVAVALLPLDRLFEFGRLTARAAAASDRTVAVVASADMSHRLTMEAPAGYSPRGAEFDRKLVELVKKNDAAGIMDFDRTLAEEAGQDALWSIAMLLGALAEAGPFTPEVLSYEGPFGVGYMVAEYRPAA